MPLQTLDLRAFEKKADNIYESVAIITKRARQINDDLKLELARRLEPVIAKETEDDTIMNQDKLQISIEFEKRKKPTQQAIEEFLDGKLSYKYREKQ
ncbi:MAG: DNA-directed RNA polymerase subunit omega [Ignavibacteria bacterium]